MPQFHVGYMLNQHQKFGLPYSNDGAGFHSGYNEIVLDGEYWAENGLPFVIEAFFIFGDGFGTEVRKAHEKFLQSFPHITSAKVPLLRLRHENFDEPFELVPAE